MPTPRSPRVINHSADGPLRAISAQYALPERFSATIEPADPDGPLCHITVAVEDGRPVVERVALERRPGGPAITSTMLRHVPVAEYAPRRRRRLAPAHSG